MFFKAIKPAKSMERAAGLLVYRTANQVVEFLLLQASYPPFHWTPPKGHVDPGEDEWQAALRETKEEAGIDAAQLTIDKDFHHVQQYVAKGNPKTVAYWLAKMNSPSQVLLSHEHQNMKWLQLEEAIELAKFKEMEEMLRKAAKYIKEKGI